MVDHITVLVATIGALVIYCVARSGSAKGDIPWAKSTMPWLGNAIEWGAGPLQFLLKQKHLVGEVFRVNLVLMKITFVIGPRVSKFRLVAMVDSELLS